MKIKKALPNLMIDGSIFKYLDVTAYMETTAAQLGIAYNFRSGEKIANSLVSNYCDEDGEITEAGESLLGNLINDYFGNDWARCADALLAEYSPIENYDRTELTTDADTGTDTSTFGAHIDTNTRAVSAFDSGTLVDADKNTANIAQRQDTLQKGTTKTINSHVHGNVGVTTNQQMIEAELKLRRQHLADIIFRDIDNFIALKCYN